MTREPVAPVCAVLFRQDIGFSVDYITPDGNKTVRSSHCVHGLF